MKKLILIALFALVSLQLKAQIKCLNVERVEVKTWSHTYKEFFITESVESWGIAKFCTDDNMVTFTFDGKTSTFFTKTKTNDYMDGIVHHTVWSLQGGGSITMSFKTTDPNYMIVSLLQDDTAITYHIPEQ